MLGFGATTFMFLIISFGSSCAGSFSSYFVYRLDVRVAVLVGFRWTGLLDRNFQIVAVPPFQLFSSVPDLLLYSDNAIPAWVSYPWFSILSRFIIAIFVLTCL